MKIAHYRYKDKECYGILRLRHIICLPELAAQLGDKLPPRLEDFIMSGEQSRRKAENLVNEAKESVFARLSVPIEEVFLLAPITSPPKIICLGLNYLDHAEETGKAVPKEPIIFMKPHTTIIGPNEKIIKPSFVKDLDYEGELAVVMGKKAKNIPALEAKNYVFGYTVFNDVSAREIQFGDRQWTRGKSFDTFAPTGPWITTEDQLPNTESLSVRTWVNDELRQNSSTKNMAFDVSQIIHHLSRVMTLEPCDIIATGTPAGVGFAMKPPKFMKNGDAVRIEIEGIGALENTVEDVDS